MMEIALNTMYYRFSVLNNTSIQRIPIAFEERITSRQAGKEDY